MGQLLRGIAGEAHGIGHAPHKRGLPLPETTFKKFAKALSFSETIVYTYICQEGKGQTAHTIERQAVTENPREKGNEMKEELKERIREFNRKAKQARANGYTVAEGYVWEGWGNPTGPCARKVCKLEDYEQGR